MNRIILGLSTAIFSVVAVLHALRLYYKWPIVIGTWHAPEWASIVGLLVAGFLAVGLFSICNKECK